MGAGLCPTRDEPQARVPSLDSSQLFPVEEQRMQASSVVQLRTRRRSELLFNCPGAGVVAFGDAPNELKFMKCVCMCLSGLYGSDKSVVDACV